MGVLEAEYAVIHGKIVEGFRAPFKEDAWYRVVVVPGFSDGHAHPQVVDAGLEPGRKWMDSYDWLENRRLRVDEAKLRADKALSSKLAKLVFLRSVLEGTTLIAVTGRLEANVSAWLSLPEKPRVIFLPTVMDRPGWPGVAEVERAALKLAKMLEDGTARIGVFVHSLRTARPETVRRALRLASRLGTLMGMHLSEGLREASLLREVLGRGPYPATIVGVHCTEEEDLPPGVYCVSCPASNIVLYGRTRKSLSGVHNFGSDWPLLLGTVPRHLGVILGAFRGMLEEVLRRATTGGYTTYGMPHQGDMVAYDDDLSKVLAGYSRPKLVAVAGRPVVMEGRTIVTGLTLRDVEAAIREAVREAIDVYPAVRAEASSP